MWTELYLIGVIIFFLVDRKWAVLRSRVVLNAITIVTLAFYFKMVVWRPDIAEKTTVNMVGNFYLPPNNLLSVGVVASILLFVTEDFMLSLIAGTFATLVWTPITLKFSRFLAGYGFYIEGWEVYFWLFALAVFFLIRYYSINAQISKLLVAAFCIYIGTFLLIAVFPGLLMGNWLRMLLGGEPAYSQTPELIADIFLRTSGYLFWSLVPIKVLGGRKRDENAIA